MFNRILQSLSLWLQGTWLQSLPLKRNHNDIGRDLITRRLTARQTYLLAAVGGRKPDLMTDMSLFGAQRIQALRNHDKQARTKWHPNIYTQDYQVPTEGGLDPKIEHYSKLFGLSRTHNKTVL